MLQQAGVNSALAFTSSSRRASRSARGESLGLSQVFPGHVHVDFQIPKTMSELSKAPTTTSASRFLFQDFWLSSYLPQLLLLPYAATVLTVIVFNKCPGNSAFLTEQALSQVK